MLVAGSCKRKATLMSGFAVEDERGGHKSPVEASYEACVLRIGPIWMTTMAARLGALPLAIGKGVGSKLRQPLSITIVGGLILSQLLTLFTTPVVYIYMDRLQTWIHDLRHGARVPTPAPAQSD